MNSENVIRVGMTAPLTGAASESGIALRQGAELAVEEVNAAEGVELDGKKYTVQLLVGDSESDPEAGVAAAEKLITQEGVHYLIGDALHSSVTMAIMDLAPRYGIPIVSGESVSQAIVDKVLADPDKYETYWKMNYGSSAYGRVVSDLVAGLGQSGVFAPQTKRAFFIVEDTDYGRSNAEAAASLLKGLGWTDAVIQPVPLDQTEFRAQLEELQSLEADLLVSIFTPVTAGAALVEQFRELEVKALHIAIYYPGEPDFLPEAGDAAEGLLWAPLDFDPDHIPAHRAFADKLQAELEVEATYDHAFGYDALHNAVDSIARAGSLEPEEIVAAVAQLDRQGVVGRYAFDPATHQAKAGPEFIPIRVAQIQGGEDQIIWPEGSATAECRIQPWLE